jgi:hypothetical protein
MPITASLPSTDLLIFFLIVGSCAGLLRDLMRTGGLILPRVQRMEDGACIVRLGFIAAMICGGAAGVLADHHWITSAVAGWAGPDFLETALNYKAAKGRPKKNATCAVSEIGTPGDKP